MTTKSLTPRWFHQILILLILLLAAWLRLWRLDTIPPGLWYDEAYNAMDALWLLETGHPQIFFLGNTGREPMWHYIAALYLAVLGSKPYVVRLVAATVGIVTVPLVYRWLRLILREDTNGKWLALFGMAGVALSYWHVTMSRVGFRTILLPLAVVLVSCFFWRGWLRRSWLYFVLAGLALGMAQYTYVAARLLPVALLLFVIVWTVFGRSPTANPRGGRRAWLGLLITGLVSVIVFLPLGLFFWIHPDSFSTRSNDVSLWTVIDEDATTLPDHLLEALSLFSGGSDSNWRHDLPGHTSFGWLNIAGFWLGLGIVLRHFRRPHYSFFLILLAVMWLPGPLSWPAIHALRLSGILPAYYALVAVGLVAGAEFVNRNLFQNSRQTWPLLFALFVGYNFTTTAVDYFVRWARSPQVFIEYDSIRLNVARLLVEESKHYDILMPFTVYEHPATRFMLHDDFAPTYGQPDFLSNRQGLLVDRTSELAQRSNATSYVFLSRAESGEGAISFSRQSWLSDISLSQVGPLTTLIDPQRNIDFLTLTRVKSLTPIHQMFTAWPSLISVNRDWLQTIRLVGYRFKPDLVQPGQTFGVELFWQLLRPDNFPDYEVIVELVNNQGNLVSVSAFAGKELFVWRPVGATISSGHLFFIGPEQPPGPYIARMRLVINNRVVPPDGVPATEQLILGLFYVAEDESDPRRPPVPIDALVVGNIELRGYAPPLPLGNNLFRGKLYWQPKASLSRDYIPFVRLISAQGDIVSDWTVPPLAGHYPTSHWQPDETVVDEFDMTLPADVSSGSYRLVAGLVDPDSGEPLSAINADGKPFPNGEILLEEITIPAK